MKIDELFDIEYPKTLAYSWLIPDENGIIRKNQSKLP